MEEIVGNYENALDFFFTSFLPAKKFEIFDSKPIPDFVY